MKKIFILTALAICSMSTYAQTRYLDEIFDDVTVSENVIYGVNATVLAYAQFGEAIPQPLVMDVYEPTGDAETARPLMIYAHTGNFLPHPQNQSPSGTNRDSVAVEICTRFAKMGYVVASIDYRLGWNPVAPTQEERVNTLINAVYRAIQDARTSIRYFRKTESEEGNPFGIDPNKIVMWGQGSGGYMALAAATLNNYSEVLLPKFIGSNGLPMVIEVVNGDINGTSFGINPLDGDTLCYPNHVGYSSDFNVCVNMGGALADISWLEEGDVPMISFQSPTDPFAPYMTGVVIVPGVNLPVVEVDGSYIVQQAANAFGNNDVFPEAALATDPITMNANSNNDGYFGLYPIITSNPLDSSPWDWWAPDNPNNTSGLITNPDMSPEKGRAYVDTIQAYAAPRLVCALGLSECALVGASINEETAIEFNVFPNPTTEQITITSAIKMDEVAVFDLTGKLVARQLNVDNNEVKIDLSDQENGVYMVTITIQGQTTSEYLVKK